MITDHSQHYIPSQTSLPQFLEKLGSANHLRNSTGSGHHFFTCTILHPTQMSCTKNFVQAWIHETRRAAPWVTSFTALAILLRKKRAIFNAGASELLLELLDSTARGTAYITGSITTAWGISCLLQRVLPSRFMPRARWLLNGSLSNVWILLLGKSRQAAISLYIARLATLSLWKVWISKGGPSIRFGELLILIASWVGLDYVRAQGSIGSIMERTLSFVEGEDPPKAQISRNNNGGE
ncbi:hypothetical protein FRC02_006866 [Tulasnella sp. 418]|nr:hypothetical protein FRC02_006866 [Tulasnella sp. 418]